MDKMEAKFRKPDNIFEHDYDLGSLQKITPKGFEFELFVTPRFLGHYAESYEGFTADLINNSAQNIDLFIDVGAHYGFFSILVGQANPDCKIIAFEPVPENFEVLKRNLILNRLVNIETKKQAVSNKHTQATFNLSTASDNGSFIQHPATPLLRQIEVETVSLNEILLNTKYSQALIKIDTDGHELQVLEGFERILLESDNIQLILELNPKCCYLNNTSPEALLKKLQFLGYDCFFLDDQGHKFYQPVDGGVNSWNSIFNEHSYINLLCKKRSVSTNILFFAHSSRLAGAERSLLELVKELNNDYGALSTVILPFHGPLEGLLQKAGAATIIAPLNWWCAPNAELPEDTVIGELYSQSFTWLNKNLSLLNQINPDIILTNTIVIPWGALAASLLKTPHIWMIHEFGELDHGLKFFEPFPQVLDFINNSSDKIITCSKAIRKELFPNQSSKKVNTIYKYIDIHVKESVPEVFGDEFFFLPDACRIIISGVVTKEKGQEDAIRAIIELTKNRKRKVELVIMGYSQPYFQNYLQEIVNAEGAGDYIHFFPFQENSMSVVNLADIVLVCSRMEGLGRVTIEAMLMEKAIIATNTGGTNEMIFDKNTGLLYTPGNYIQLADQIERLLDNPEERLNLARNACRFAKKTFTKKNFGWKYYKILVALKNEEYKVKEGIWWFLWRQYQRFLDQKEQSMQALSAQRMLHAITIIKAWRVVMFLRQLRMLLFPRRS